MNRIEMFAELKKDPTKRFRTSTYEYFVSKDGKLLFKGFNDSDYKAELVEYLGFNSKSKCFEVKKPFKDRVKIGDVYFAFSSSDLEVWDSKYVDDNIDRRSIEIGNFFETKEECEEAVRKIKELLKG